MATIKPVVSLTMLSEIVHSDTISIERRIQEVAEFIDGLNERIEIAQNWLNQLKEQKSVGEQSR